MNIYLFNLTRYFNFSLSIPSFWMSGTLTLGLKLALNPVTKLGDSIEESINVIAGA